MKKLSLKNWLVSESVCSRFVKPDPANGYFVPLSGEDFAREILQPKLSKKVPDEVRRLFEVARGAMLYGYFFYPLFTLGAEQLSRVGEAAVAIKCEAIGCPAKIKTFEKRIDFLLESKIITNMDAAFWHGFRRERNRASHPRFQVIMAPFMTSGFLRGLARLSTKLFR